MAVLGLSVNPRVEPNIVWQGNNMYMYVVVRLIWSLRMYRSCQALLEVAINYWTSRSTRPMSIYTWTHRVARLRGWKPNSGWTQIRQGLGFLIVPSIRGWLEDIYIREGGGAARVNPTPLGRRCCSPTLVPFAPREPSSPEAQRFFPARVGYLRGAASGAQWWTTREVVWSMTMQLHDTTTMRTTTLSRFRCICESSGNCVIYNLQLILVYEVEIFVS